VTDDNKCFEDKDVIVISAGGYDLAKLDENESSVLASMQQTVEQGTQRRTLQRHHGATPAAEGCHWI
jgi:hypothetical protein